MNRWLVIAALLGLLGFVLWFAYRQWTHIDFDVPAWVWWSMGLGAGATFLVGGGLMALIFYSSRQGYDEPPNRIEPPDHRD